MEPLRINVAGIVIDVEFDKDFDDDREKRYSAFETTEEPMVRIALELDDDNVAPMSMPIVEKTESGYQVTRHEFVFNLDGNVDSGWVGRGRLFAVQTSLDTMLRVITTIVLAETGRGFMFHACGLALHEKGYLFPGPSEMGKSTLAMKTGRPVTLSDELVAVTHDDGQWLIHATPFWGSFEYGERNRSMPLEDVFLLNRHVEQGVHDVRKADAVARLLSLVLCFDHRDETAAAQLARITRLVEDYTPRELSYQPSQPLDDVLGMIGVAPGAAQGAVE